MFINKKYLKALIVLSLIAPKSIAPNYIIFDLDTVLLTLNKKLMFQHLGWTNLAQYTLKDHKNPLHLEQLLSTIILNRDHIHKASCRSLFDANNLIRESLLYIERLRDEKKFSSDLEYYLIEKLLGILYQPEQLVQLLKPSYEALSLLKKCAEQHTILATTQWDTNTINLFYQAQHLEMLFAQLNKNNIIPLEPTKHTRGYTLQLSNLLRSIKCPADACCIITSQRAVAKAAKKIGIACISIHNNNFARVEKELKNLLYVK